MTPVKCRVKHDPPNSNGDCLRACVASVLDKDAEDVPHFFADHADGSRGQRQLTEWLATQNYVPFFVHWDGGTSVAELLNSQRESNPTVHYLLFGATATGDHVVVCRGGEIVHDPNWYPQKIVGCPSNGIWTILVVARA